MYTHEEMNRREVMKLGASAATGLALFGLSCAGIDGCISSSRRETQDGYARAGERLLDIAISRYPAFKEEKEQALKPEDLKTALRAADQALACYAELLSVPHPMDHRHPLINYFHEPGSNSDAWLSENDMRQLPEYRRARLVCERLRDYLPAVVELSRDYLQAALHDSELSKDPHAADYLATLTPRLEILALRMREGKLMVSDNVLHSRNKFGHFAELIGQTEHYQEARAEIRTLLDYLEQSAQQIEAAAGPL